VNATVTLEGAIPELYVTHPKTGEKIYVSKRDGSMLRPKPGERWYVRFYRYRKGPMRVVLERRVSRARLNAWDLMTSSERAQRKGEI